MAFQIEESKLSSEAKKALNNAKSKSQFVRDAIEFYVRNVPSYGFDDQEIKQDIKDIKDMLKHLTDSSLSLGIESYIEQAAGTVLEDTKGFLKPVDTIPEEVNTNDILETHTGQIEDIKEDDLNLSTSVNDDVTSNVLGSIKKFRIL